MSALHVWMNGDLVGVWFTAPGKPHVFRYEASWVASAHGRALSLSIPITPGAHEVRGAAVENYFDNLLPDSDAIRKRLQTRFKTRGVDAYSLLTAIGRDCVGAVQLLPPNEAPVGYNQIESRALTEADVEQQLLNVTTNNPLGAADDAAEFRISIAGAQEKSALLYHQGQWSRPLGATPTTHILKLPLGLVGGRNLDLSQSVENEWLCAKILGELQFAVARTEMVQFGRTQALVVERFDRQWITQTSAPPWIARLPQEDFCQATATAPHEKYEQDGGPGIARCLHLLSASEQAVADKRRFALTQLAFWLLAATDGHAKNFSIFNLRGGAFVMTPLYDVLSAWPIVGTGHNKLPLQKVNMAMALRGKSAHYQLRSMQPRHWQALAQQAGGSSAGGREVWAAMQTLVNHAPAALQRALNQLPKGFPAQVAQSISDGVMRQVPFFLEAPQT
jgi:serine/threonine-protein kinase HipA